MREWINKTGMKNTIMEDSSTGDAIIRQGNLALSANYDYWPHLLLHGIFFCYQTSLPVPNPFNLSTTSVGLNNTSGEPVILLQSTIYRAESRKRIIIPSETEQEEIDLQISSDAHFDYNPKISEGNLIYIGQDGRKVLTFTQADISHFFEGVTEPMTRNVRGNKPRLEAVYSEFPWEFYNQRKA